MGSTAGIFAFLLSHISSSVGLSDSKICALTNLHVQENIKGLAHKSPTIFSNGQFNRDLEGKTQYNNRRQDPI